MLSLRMHFSRLLLCHWQSGRCRWSDKNAHDKLGEFKKDSDISLVILCMQPAHREEPVLGIAL